MTAGGDGRPATCGRMYRTRVYPSTQSLARALAEELGAMVGAVHVLPTGLSHDIAEAIRGVSERRGIEEPCAPETTLIAALNTDTGLAAAPPSRCTRAVIIITGEAMREPARRFLRATYETDAGTLLREVERVDVWLDADAWPLG